MRGSLHYPIVLLAVAIIVGGCSAPPAAQAPTSAPTAEATVASLPSPTVEPSATPEPTATPEPSLTPEPSATPEPTAVPSPTPLAVEGTLSVPQGSVTARPYAVMIDNHPNAFPQTGLNEAAIVFEALAEFGLTRYMAVYVPGVSPEISEIGPVRSARPYFVEWAKGMRAAYIHAGGSPEGLLLAETSIELVNMDALRGNASGSFRRSSAKEAPHNLFTDSASIAAFVDAFDPPADGLAEIGFAYSAALPADQRPAAQSIEYFFTYRETFVRWEYNPVTNTYLYFRQNRPHIDARSGAQIEFNNLIVLEVPETPIPGDEKRRIEQQVVGEGPARLFRDGQVIEATWRKPAGFAPLELYTADDVEITLTPGNVWIAAIPVLENLTITE